MTRATTDSWTQPALHYNTVEKWDGWLRNSTEASRQAR